VLTHRKNVLLLAEWTTKPYANWTGTAGNLYCCTVHFEDSLNITHQQMHQFFLLYISLKLFTLKHFPAPTCFDNTSHIIIREHV